MTVLGGLRRRGHQVRPQSRRCRAVVDGPSPKHRRTSRRTRACIGHPSSRRGSFDAVRLTFEPQKFVRRSVRQHSIKGEPLPRPSPVAPSKPA